MAQQRDKVSVLLNNHNYRDFACEAIRSVLDQTLPPDEIIVVDDGSTDGSVEMFEMEFKDEPRVQIVTKSNRGQLSAFNAGFALSTGDLIFFLDADDLFGPRYIESAVAFYERNHDCDLLYCGWEKFGKVSEVVLDHPVNWDFGFSVLETLLARDWRAGPTSALSFRRSSLERFLPLDLLSDWKTRADDCLLWGSTTAGAHKFFMAEVHVKYRVHDNNAWYGRVFSNHYEVSRAFKLNRMVGTVAKNRGYFLPGLLDQLISEFESAGSGRDWRSYKRYRKIISRSDRAFIWRCRQHKKLLLSYLGMRFRRARREP